jgi:acetyltransferase-like isoleucine patch superfamily enzyme
MNIVKRIYARLYKFIFEDIFYAVCRIVPFLRPIYYTKDNESPVEFKTWYRQKVLGHNKHCYWPVHFTSTVRFPNNIYVGIDAAPGISPGCYIQAVGKIVIDDYTQIAPNVGIISSNHFMLDIRKHIESEVRIGKYCRIGMGSIINAGVVLGDFTTVSSGSVVTKSFPKGYCVIGGNPAEIIADYSDNPSIMEKFVRYRNEHEYNGYIRSSDFEKYKRKYLKKFA